ncbi:MAG: hypothetical protein ACYDG2_10815 [Ruminiclostridium sp.]
MGNECAMIPTAIKVLLDMSLWLEAEAVMDQEKNREQYQASKCLMCGCCLEVCPNF